MGRVTPSLPFRVVVYRFGLYRYHGYWGYPIWGPYPYGYPDDFISIEVPYKTAFFEGNRCTGWEYITDNR